MDKKYPIFEAFFTPENDKLDLQTVSLVDYPAIEKDFIYFNKDKEQTLIQFSTDEKMIVKGPALIPNQLIYRNSGGRERYIYFSEDTIQKFVENFLSKSNNKINIDHSNNFINTNIVESYFASENNEFNVPKGSWILSLKVNDKNIWDKIKKGEYNGFSIQGMFSEQLEKFSNENIDTNKQDNMTLKEKLIQAINTILFDEDPVSGDTQPVSGETKPVELAEEIKPIEQPVEQPASGETQPVEQPVEQPASGETQPVVEEPAPVVVTEESIQSMIDKSNEATINKLSEMINELNKKIEQIGNTPIPSDKKEETVNIPRVSTSGAARFVSRD